MADPSDFKRGEIIGARLAGTSVIKTAELFSVARCTVWKGMTAYEKEGKISLNQNSGRKRKLSDRDLRTLTRIFRKDHKNTAPNITAERNDHLETPVSSNTVKRELHKAGFSWEDCNHIKINLFEISRCFFIILSNPIHLSHFIYTFLYIYHGYICICSMQT